MRILIQSVGKPAPTLLKWVAPVPVIPFVSPEDWNAGLWLHPTGLAVASVKPSEGSNSGRVVRLDPVSGISLPSAHFRRQVPIGRTRLVAWHLRFVRFLETPLDQQPSLCTEALDPATGWRPSQPAGPVFRVCRHVTGGQSPGRSRRCARSRPPPSCCRRPGAAAEDQSPRSVDRVGPRSLRHTVGLVAGAGRSFACVGVQQSFVYAPEGAGRGLATGVAGWPCRLRVLPTASSWSGGSQQR